MRIACLLADGYEESELRIPFDRFWSAGHQVVAIGADKLRPVTGKHGEEQVELDFSIFEVDPADFDALFIPGGHSPDALRAHPAMVAFAHGFREKPILAICHGPQLLMTAGLVEGRTMTAWRTVQNDLRNAGANVIDAEVVTDGLLVTSRHPGDLDAFVAASLEVLAQTRELPQYGREVMAQ